MTDPSLTEETTQTPNAIVGVTIERHRRGAIGLRLEPSLRYIPVSTTSGDPSLANSLAAYTFASTTTLFELPVQAVLPVFSVDSSFVIRVFAGPTVWLPIAQTLQSTVTQRVTVSNVEEISRSGIASTTTEFGSLAVNATAGSDAIISISSTLRAVAGIRASYWPSVTTLGAGGGVDPNMGTTFIARHNTPRWSFGLSLGLLAQL